MNLLSAVEVIVFRAFPSHWQVGPVHLPGNVVWTAHEFFLREIPALGKLVPAIDKASHLEQMLGKLTQDVIGYENQVQQVNK